MSLRAKTEQLCDVLEAIVVGLESYDKDARSSYTKPLGAKLRPMVNAYRDAVFVQRSRVNAKQALDNLKEIMHNVNGAATKGEIDFIEDKVLNKYWDFNTLFQESRYRDQQL